MNLAAVMKLATSLFSGKMDKAAIADLGSQFITEKNVHELQASIQTQYITECQKLKDGQYLTIELMPHTVDGYFQQLKLVVWLCEGESKTVHKEYLASDVSAEMLQALLHSFLNNNNQKAIADGQ